MPADTCYDPLTHNESTPFHKPGTLLKYKDGVILAYYRVETQDCSQGHVVYPASATGDEVTSDTATGIGVITSGVAMADISDGNYGYFQVTGIGQVALLTDGNVAAGSALEADAAGTDGRVLVATVGTDQVMGVAFAADAGTVLAAGAYRLCGII